MNAPAVGHRLDAAMLHLRAAADEVRRALRVADEGDRSALREALGDIYDATSTCESLARRHRAPTGSPR